MANPEFDNKPAEELIEDAPETHPLFGGPAKRISTAKGVCGTELRYEAVPGEPTPLETLVNVTGGVVRLWERNVTLRWRFDEESLKHFKKPERAKELVRALIQQGLALWQSALPVTISEDQTRFDFEVAVPNTDSPNGPYILADAFFPGATERKLTLYPFLFEQQESVQTKTLAHEFGHLFGLRHFFAQDDEKEKKFPSVLFDTHDKFTIINYDSESVMTQADRDDLQLLYKTAWNGSLKNIGGIAIEFVKPS